MVVICVMCSGCKLCGALYYTIEEGSKDIHENGHFALETKDFVMLPRYDFDAVEYSDVSESERSIVLECLFGETRIICIT